MAETPGILCQLRDPRNNNDGTMCAAQSPKPGIQGDRGWLGTAWDDLLWAGNKTLDGAAWAGNEALAGAEWTGGEIVAGAKWSWGEIRGGAIWIGNKAYDAYKYLLSLIEKVKNAADWRTLAAIAEPILGPSFLEAGVLAGIVESLGKDIFALLELGKMVVLAGLYELMQHPQAATALAMNPGTLPMVLTALALKAAAAQVPGLVTELKKADDQLKKMLNDLLGIVKDIPGFVKALGKQIKQETLDDFNKLKYYSEHRTLSNDFATGRILGRVLYQVVMLILLVLSVAGAVAKLAARVPWLLRAARILKTGGEVEELVQAERVLQETKTAEEIAEAEKIKEPPKPPVKKTNPKTRLPRSNGEWKNGTPGNGDWYSNNPKVKAITGDKPVRFTDGRPDFSPWSKGEIEFEPGELDGTDADFDKVYDVIKEQKGLSSRAAAERYLREQGLTPHHLDDKTIQLIPSDLHGNVPHIGGASDLRGGFGNDASSPGIGDNGGPPLDDPPAPAPLPDSPDGP